MSGKRRGVAFIDVVMAACAAAFLLALVVSAVQRARSTARRNQCRHNLQLVGEAVFSYHSTHQVLPAIAPAGGPVEIGISVHASLLPYLDLSGLDGSDAADAASGYDAARPWYEQSPEIASRVIPAFVCPSSAHPRVHDSAAFGQRGLPVGSGLGTTDYIVSVGPRDAWCLPQEPYAAGPIPEQALGAFGLSRTVTLEDITDGTGQTMLIGEGTGGPGWAMCRAAQYPRAFVNPTTGEPALSVNAWINPEINTDRLQAETAIVTGGLYGSTAVRLNIQHLRPAMETVAVVAALDDCRSSSNGGPHRVSGFRSDHVVGCLFLFGDGSVHCVQGGIDVGLYDALSTIRGEERIEIAGSAAQQP